MQGAVDRARVPVEAGLNVRGLERPTWRFEPSGWRRTRRNITAWLRAIVTLALGWGRLLPRGHG